MGSILFIVWRESLEAVLVITILYSFLKRQTRDSRAVTSMWAGVSAGLALSLFFAIVTVTVQDSLQGNALDYFQAGTLLFSSLLMTQMVMWMNRHGRMMKKELESNLSQAMSTSGLWGAAIVSALAIAREGAETVVYLYGMSLEGTTGKAGLAVASVLGLSLALGTAWAVSRGVRFLNYQLFFKITTWVLLLSAAGLLVGGVNRLIEMDVLPALKNPVWNTSAVLSGSSEIGRLFSAFTGYTPAPSLMLVLVYAAYWGVVFILMKKAAQAQNVGSPSVEPVPLRRLSG